MRAFAGVRIYLFVNHFDFEIVQIEIAKIFIESKSGSKKFTNENIFK